MGDLLMRERQRELLTTLMRHYPGWLRPNQVSDFPGDNSLRVNIAYLMEHGLVEAQFAHDLKNDPLLLQAKITAKGIDFLADDGGLSAILGVVTIKLHEEDLRQLIEAKIRESDEDPSQKQRLLDQLRELPAETTKHLALQLVDAGLRNWPVALQLLQRFLG
ncbi:hypothetical protein [Xanthomonas sp. 3498]|uniref:hypothetical protein n=1 Tax=Xanthomonas sp. 3498 TaxID=2663863 RepID=UPI00160C87C5|nr:hypothetical protein [Xanthomonas sp. 3498]MBB5875866.1 hypothetical protein [Xanthomonas sp. 3498]